MSSRKAGAVSLGAAMAALLGGSAAWADAAPADTASSPALSDAIASGKLILEFRPRFEGVDQANLKRDAEAYTLRTHLGWETGAWHGAKALIEISDVAHTGPEHYNTTVNGKTLYPVIGDPDQVRLNRAQLNWTANDNFSVTLGRQRINLDDQRFVGNANWRQNEQTFDAARVDAGYGPLKATYIYIGHVNRVFGDTLDWSSESHLFNAGYTLSDLLKVQGFYYALDFTTSTAAAKAASTATSGAKVTGKAWVSLYQLAYGATYAHQTEYGRNPGHFALDYWEGDVTGTFDIYSVKAMYESMEGDGVRGFATPLATLHIYQGWADAFLTTPAKGIQDANLALSVKPRFKFTYLYNTEFFVRYHDFKTETTDKSLGSEWDLQATGAITPKITALAKVADYHGVTGTPSRTKVWFGFEYKF